MPPEILNFQDIRQNTIDFLLSLPGGGHSYQERLSLVYSAGLDDELIKQIEFTGSAITFFQILVNKLIDYGQLKDGRISIIAILESNKSLVGIDKQQQIDNLIGDWQKYEYEQKNVLSEDKNVNSLQKYLLYEVTINQLLDKIGNNHPFYIKILSLRHELLNNISKAQILFNSNELQCERAQILNYIDQLNRYLK